MKYQGNSWIHRSQTSRGHARSNVMQSPKGRKSVVSTHVIKSMSCCMQRLPWIRRQWFSAKHIVACSTAATRTKRKRTGKCTTQQLQKGWIESTRTTTVAKVKLIKSYCTHVWWCTIIIRNPPTWSFIYLEIERINLQMNLLWSPLIIKWPCRTSNVVSEMN